MQHSTWTHHATDMGLIIPHDQISHLTERTAPILTETVGDTAQQLAHETDAPPAFFWTLSCATLRGFPGGRPVPSV